MRVRRFAALAAVCGIAMAGCAGIPADRGATATRDLVASRSSTAGSMALDPMAEDAVADFMARVRAAPVGANEAVQLALINNPGLRQLYAELGFAQADVYDASRLANPSLGFLRLASEGAGLGAQTTWSLTQGFMELLFIRYRTRMGKTELLQSQQRVAHEILQLEADVRRAYYEDVGARLSARMRGGVATAATLSAELAARFHEAGNISALQRAREEAAAAAALIDRRRAETRAIATRGALLTLMGLPVGDARITFFEQLPLPAKLITGTADLQAQAVRQRLDLLARRTEVALLRDQLAHFRRWRWLGGLTAKVERETEPDGNVLRGGGGSVDLPVFNAGGGSLLRAQAAVESAAATMVSLELRTTNDIAVQRAAVEAARETVDDYRLRLAPLRERIVALSQQQQNFMFIGAFELLAARREEIETFGSYIEAVRDYWIARTEFLRTLGGPWPDPEPEGTSLEVPTLPSDIPSVSSEAPGAAGGSQ